MSKSLSIIVPVYNAEQYVRTCLQSLADQTANDYEVILVNDSSRDASLDICQNFVSRFPDVFSLYTIENSGVSVARNEGIKHAAGTYLSFVDADDWVEHDYVETLLRETVGVDLLYIGQSHHFPDSSIRSYAIEQSLSVTPQDIEKSIFLLKENEAKMEIYGFTWNKCFRRELIEKNHIGFVPHLSVREDEVFTSRYCRNICSLKTISKILYHYRVLPNGLTRKKNVGDEIYLLASELHKTTNGILDRRLYLYELERTFNYYFEAAMKMPLKKALSIFAKLYGLYHEWTPEIRFRHGTYRLVFCHTRVVSRCLYVVIWRVRHKR